MIKFLAVLDIFFFTHNECLDYLIGFLINFFRKSASKDNLYQNLIVVNLLDFENYKESFWTNLEFNLSLNYFEDSDQFRIVSIKLVIF